MAKVLFWQSEPTTSSTSNVELKDKKTVQQSINSKGSVCKCIKITYQLLFLIIFTFGLSSIVYANSVWEQLNSNNIPAAREGLSTVTINDKVYLYGGRNSNGILGELLIYDPSNNSWSQGAPSINSMGHTSTVINGKMYVFGGYSGSDLLNALRVYDPINNSWSTLSTTGPSKRMGHSAGAIGNNLYIFAGSDVAKTGRMVGNEYNDLWVFNTINNSWSQLNPSGSLPAKRRYAISDTFGGKLYIFGGDVGYHYGYGDLLSYDPASNKWTQVAASPGGYKYYPLGHSGMFIGENLYVFGGKHDPGYRTDPIDVNNLYIYNIKTNKWVKSTVDNSPSPRDSQAQVFVNGKLYIFWGQNTGSSEDIVALQTLKEDVWTYILPSGSVSINNNAQTTNNTNVQLNISALYATKMMISNNSNFTGANWENCIPNKNWALTSDSGSKTVYIKFKDNVGNESKIYSASIILDKSAPTGSIVINDQAAATNNLSGTLTMSASDIGSGIQQMMLSNNSNFSQASWEPYDTQKSCTLSSVDGTKTEYIKFKDNAGNESQIFSDKIVLDTTAPTGTIIINKGAVATNNTNVTLNISSLDAGVGVQQMMLSNSIDFSEAVWESYSNKKSWILTSTEGTKTVYIKFKDKLGNQSGIIRDDIILATTAPKGTIKINDGGVATNNSNVTLIISSSDLKGTLQYVALSNDANFSQTVWQAIYNTTVQKSWTLIPGDGNKAVYVKFKDIAGNESLVYSDDIVLDTSVPLGAITINNGSEMTNTPNIILTIANSDIGTGVSQMLISSSSNFAQTVWEPVYNPSVQKSLTLTPGDGTKTVYIKFKDLSGNISAVYNDNIILDTTAPAGTIIINNGVETTNNAKVTLTISVSDSGTGIDQMTLSNDINFRQTVWEDLNTPSIEKNWSFASGYGSRTVYIKFKDKAGNISQVFNDSIILDTIPPTGAIVINDDAAGTENTSTALTITASDMGLGVEQMMISNNANFSQATWEAAATSIKKNWILTKGDGKKSVYIKFKDKLGNTSRTYSDVIILSTQHLSGDILINKGASKINKANAALTIYSNGANQMRISNNKDFSETQNNVASKDISNVAPEDLITERFAAWEPYNTSKKWTLTSATGTKTVYIQFKDASENTSSTYSDSILYDPSYLAGGIKINNDAVKTNKTSVALSVNSNGATQMMVSNYANFSGATWISYTKAMKWTLSTGYGTKTVYVQFKDAYGNLSDTYSDSITLDSTYLTGRIIINNGLVGTNRASVSLDVYSNGAAQMMISNTSDFANASWISYTIKKSWTLISGPEKKTVYIKFRDTAGNVSKVYKDDIILDTTAPTGTLKINNGAAITTNKNVKLSITSSDAVQGISVVSKVKEMRIGTSSLSNIAWENYKTNKTWTLSDGDGKKKIYIQFKDNAQNISKVFNAGIILDATAPIGNIKINNNAQATNSTSVTLAVHSNSTSKMMISNSSNFAGASWINYATSKNWTLLSGQGTKTVYIKFKDTAGNISNIYNDSIIYDTTVPTGNIKINANDNATNKRTATLTISAADTHSGLKVMRISNENTAINNVAWINYAASKSWTLTSGQGTKTVSIQFRDKVGNTSSVYRDTIILDTTAPKISSFKINNDAVAASKTNVTLKTTVSDTVTGISTVSGVKKIRICNDNSNNLNNAEWQTYSASKSWILAPGNGPKKVFIQIQDGAGNISTIHQKGIVLAEPVTYTADQMYGYLSRLETLANQYKAQHSDIRDNKNQLMLQYIRRGKYNNDSLSWSIMAGDINSQFVSYVNTTDSGLSTIFSQNSYPEINLLDTKTGKKIDFIHFAATLNGNIYNTRFDTWFSGATEADVDPYTGWGGDLQTTIKNMRIKEAQENANDNYDKLYNIERAIIGSETWGSFGISDMLSDIDAFNIGNALSNETTSFADTFKNYYSNNAGTNFSAAKRFSSFLSGYGGETGLASMTQKFTTLHGNLRDHIFDGVNPKPTNNEFLAMKNAFVDYIKDAASKE